MTNNAADTAFAARLDAVEHVEAPFGQRMIEVRLKFFTNNMGPAGTVVPRNCWAKGFASMVAVRANQ
jgi:hypothetical protein